MWTIKVKATAGKKDPSVVKLDLIFFKTGYNRVPKSLGISGDAGAWSEISSSFKSNGRFQSKSAEHATKNKIILDTVRQYSLIAERWRAEGIDWTPVDLAHALDEKKVHVIESESVYCAIIQYRDIVASKRKLKNGELVGCIKSADFYNTILRSLNRFTTSKFSRELNTFLFSEINESFIREWIIFTRREVLKTKGSSGSLQNKLRKFKTVVTWAKSHGFKDANVAIFDNVKSEMKPAVLTATKTVSYQAIMKISHMDASQLNERQTLFLDLFLFSFYSGGMANVDVCTLKTSCIQDYTIVYERMKCRRIAKPVLTEKAKEIIAKYKGKGYADYVFPVLTDRTLTDQSREMKIHTTTSSVNNLLRGVVKTLGIKENVTWYSARGAFITKMVTDGWDVMSIADMAGNSPEIISKHYFKITELDQVKNRVDNMFK